MLTLFVKAGGSERNAVNTTLKEGRRGGLLIWARCNYLWSQWSVTIDFDWVCGNQDNIWIREHTLGVCPFTFPARAKEPWTLPKYQEKRCQTFDIDSVNYMHLLNWREGRTGNKCPCLNGRPLTIQVQRREFRIPLHQCRGSRDYEDWCLAVMHSVPSNEVEGWLYKIVFWLSNCIYFSFLLL